MYLVLFMLVAGFTRKDTSQCNVDKDSQQKWLAVLIYQPALEHSAHETCGNRYLLICQ